MSCEPHTLSSQVRTAICEVVSCERSWVGPAREERCALWDGRRPVRFNETFVPSIRAGPGLGKVRDEGILVRIALFFLLPIRRFLEVN